MFGFQEMLFVATIILAVIFIPKMILKRPARRQGERTIHLSGVLRFAIAVSVIYPALVAAYFRPWQKDPLLFFYVGVGPVVLGWLLFWVAAGFWRK